MEQATRRLLSSAVMHRVAQPIKDGGYRSDQSATDQDPNPKPYIQQGCDAGYALAQMEFSALTARTGDDEFVTTADRVIEHLHQLYPEQARPPHAGPAPWHPVSASWPYHWLLCQVCGSVAVAPVEHCRQVEGLRAQTQSASQASCSLSP